MKKRFLPLLFIAASLMTLTGCMTNRYESGTRTNVLFGVVDYKSDYSSYGAVYDSGNSSLKSESVMLARSPSSGAAGYSERVDGKSLSILWGLGGKYNWQ